MSWSLHALVVAYALSFSALLELPDRCFALPEIEPHFRSSASDALVSDDALAFVSWVRTMVSCRTDALLLLSSEVSLLSWALDAG